MLMFFSLCVYALLLILRYITRILQATPDFTESVDFHIYETQYLAFLPNFSHNSVFYLPKKKNLERCKLHSK